MIFYLADSLEIGPHP